jgi:hypothetical protein
MADAENKRSPGDESQERKFKIRLKLVDRETGESRYCSLDEAKTWNWENPEIWRMMNGWQITSFQKLLNLLYEKMQKGIKEVEIVEAPRFTMLAGG